MDGVSTNVEWDCQQIESDSGPYTTTNIGRSLCKLTRRRSLRCKKKRKDESTSMAHLLHVSLQRKCAQCEFTTEYTHYGVSRWLCDILGEGWTVYPPHHISDVERRKPAANWPEEGNERDTILEILRGEGCVNPEDLINGHCEAIALMLSRVTEDILKDNPALGVGVNPRAHDLFFERMQKLGPANAANLVFAGFLGGIVEGTESWTRSVWGEKFTQNTIESLLYSDSSAVQEYMKGFSVKLLNSENERDKIETVPLYMICYIFDCDELDDEDLKNCTIESAQYSCHVVGIVMDARHKNVFIADPNGDLVHGSNMEFVCVPLEKRPAKVRSTAISQYDIDVAKKRM